MTIETELQHLSDLREGLVSEFEGGAAFIAACVRRLTEAGEDRQQALKALDDLLAACRYLSRAAHETAAALSPPGQ